MCASIAPDMNIRSSSFHVLPRDSSGDGDLLHSPTDDKSLAGGRHRRCRRNKNKKNNLSQPTVELGLGSGLLEGRPFDDRARAAVSTPGGFMDPDDHYDNRHFGQESFLGAQQWERMPSVSNSHVSTVLTACISQFSNGSLSPPSHTVEGLFNGTHLAYSGMSEVDLNGQMQSSITACNPDSTADGVLAYTYVKKDKMSHQQSMEKRHARDKSYYPDSSVLVQALVKKDKDCDQLSIVERQQGQNGSVDSVPAESRVHDGTDHSSLAVSKTQTSLSCSADDGQVFNSFRSTNEDVVSPDVISEVEVFVDDGSASWSSQFSRAELRQRTTHNLVKDSSQCESDHAVEVPLQNKENQAASITAASECSTRDVNRDSHGGGYYYQTPDKLTHVPVMHVETPDLLDWEQLMSANSLCSQPAIASPLEYFIGEVLRSPPTLQETQSAETDKKRQHVYNTMFHVPWRCELLIIVGFFVCLDSFLSLLTVMPVRIIIFLWRFFAKGRQFRRLRADELSDLGSLLVLVGGVTLLQQTDISYIYHMIRSQATIKLYVVYNVLEIFDKLCQSFGSDVLQVLLNSAENVATCPSVALLSETFRFILDQCIAVVSFVVHSFIILAQSITVSAAIRSHNNALLTLLISNNFAEIKSNVFKRLAKDNLHKLAYLDTVERFHIIAHLFFVLAQNLLAADEPWLSAFACNAGMVFLCEILVDVIKHAFLAKFNEIKPAAYSEFLLVLCKQTLNSQSHEVHKTMSFVPFAPACVVIRVLIPLYAAYLPGAFLWRLLCMLIYGIMTYLFLVTLKILVALGLSKHASWYIARYRKKEKLLHFD